VLGFSVSPREGGRFPQVAVTAEGDLVSDLLLRGISFVIRSNMGLDRAAGRAQSV
jgi:hypothetical protein